MTTIVTTQTELDQALAADSPDIIIDSPVGVWLSLDHGTVSVRGSSWVGPVWGSATVSGVWGSATVRDVWGSATVRDVWGSATVSGVRGSATVSGVSGSATVRDVWDSATVSGVRGSATVSGVRGSATVRLYDRAKATHVGPYVAVHLHSAKATVDGGVIIDLTKLDLTQPGDWLAYHGATVTKAGYATLYKAVLDDWTTSSRGTQWTYRPGATVTAADFAPTRKCGQGLHLCVTPRQSQGYLSGATRFVAVKVKAADLIPLDDKAKVPSCKVLYEVDVDGVRVQS